MFYALASHGARTLLCSQEVRFTKSIVLSAISFIMDKQIEPWQHNRAVWVWDSNSKVPKYANEFGHFTWTLKHTTAVEKARDYHNRLFLEAWNSQRRPKCRQRTYRHSKYLQLSFDAFFSSLSIGREPTTWPANNCRQIMVCSCVLPLKRILLQIIFCSCVIGTTLSREKWHIPSLSCQEVIKI